MSILHIINNFVIEIAIRITDKIFGGFDTLLYSLISFIIIDYLTGIILAIKNKKLSSKIGYRGILKKVTIILIICMGNIMDKYILYTGNTLRTIIIMFYIANEGISILENVGEIGLPIPQKLKDVIKKLNNNN